MACYTIFILVFSANSFKFFLSRQTIFYQVIFNYKPIDQNHQKRCLQHHQFRRKNVESSKYCIIYFSVSNHRVPNWDVLFGISTDDMRYSHHMVAMTFDVFVDERTNIAYVHDVISSLNVHHIAMDRRLFQDDKMLI